MENRPHLDQAVQALIDTLYKALTHTKAGDALPAQRVNTALQALGGALYGMQEDIKALQAEIAALKSRG